MKLNDNSISIVALDEKIKRLEDYMSMLNRSIKSNEESLKKLREEKEIYQKDIDELNETINYLKSSYKD